MKMMIVSSSELARYDNWAPSFHLLMKASRERSPDRVDAFWTYITESRKRRKDDVCREICDCPGIDAAVELVQDILFGNKVRRSPIRLKDDDKAAIAETIRAVVESQIFMRRAELDEKIKNLQQTEEKFRA